MESEVKPAVHVEPKPPTPAMVRVLFLIRVFFVLFFFFLILLLGISMVHHRFFRGERVHPNGSVGQ
jgi:hypothetical protein